MQYCVQKCSILTKVKISGKRLIDKKVKSFDGKDLGKIKSVTPEYVELKDGSKRYLVPKDTHKGT